jgi:soluble cytochrome b562
MHYYRHLIGIFGGILAVIFATSNILVIGSLASPEVENHEPQEISAQITQAREAIENELKKQGEILTEAIKQQFGFENVQSNLSQAYQVSFTGELESAKNQVRSADSALEDSVISLLKSGQQLISASQNESIVLDNNSRAILNNFGETLSNLSITTNELQSQLP